MQRVDMSVQQKDNIKLNVTERIASYEEMMRILEKYIDDLLESLGISENRVQFETSLPETGEEDVLYVMTTTGEIYIWKDEEYVQINVGNISLRVATDEEVEEALDALFQ